MSSFPFLDIASAPPYQQVFDYGLRTDQQPVYIGWATCGVPQSASSWKIRLFTYNSDGSIAQIQYANGDVGFRAIWNNRTSYVYS
jgi:hypothetical protein